MANVEGVGPDAPVGTNNNGGKQSVSPYRVDLLPAEAVLCVSAILAKGAAKYGENNWRRLSVEEHINHQLVHLFAYLAGDISDDHLGHAACRGLMALEINRVGMVADRPPEKGDQC